MTQIDKLKEVKKSKFKPLNSVIQVCPDCGKVDVSEGHEEDCDPEWEAAREENLEHYN